MTDALILVPGYNHDPDDPHHSPSRIPDGHFYLWQTGAFSGRPVIPFPWYSGRQFRDVLRAWRAGYWDTYKWAYGDLSVAAAKRLSRMPPGHPVFAHSLGSRVVMKALEFTPGLFCRVILCNGAVHQKEALAVMESNPGVEFLNVAVKTDHVLSLAGAWFGPALGREATVGTGIAKYPGNVRQVVLDDPENQAWYKDHYGWSLQGDDPNSVGDHSYSFQWPGNWPLFHAFLQDGL
ncbi:hypothetical protein [Aestuariispira insulae]|uniref:hypothetical protein n=1 Tax=Aestuariispira insulae TaxID=1461337 RepID=UPI0011C03EE6|nr:hypothetical protein [Aestuariispira insulae]